MLSDGFYVKAFKKHLLGPGRLQGLLSRGTARLTQGQSVRVNIRETGADALLEVSVQRSWLWIFALWNEPSSLWIRLI